MYFVILREDIITGSNVVQNLQTAPPPKRDFLQGESAKFEQLLKKNNVSTFTEMSFHSFYHIKKVNTDSVLQRPPSEDNRILSQERRQVWEKDPEK